MDASWKSWVAPFVDCLEEAIDRANGAGRGLKEQAFFTGVANLCYTWTQQPVSQLVEYIKKVKWLELLAGERLALVADGYEGIIPLMPEDGAELPVFLARLLNDDSMIGQIGEQVHPDLYEIHWDEKKGTLDIEWGLNVSPGQIRLAILGSKTGSIRLLDDASNLDVIPVWGERQRWVDDTLITESIYKIPVQNWMWKGSRRSITFLNKPELTEIIHVG